MKPLAELVEVLFKSGYARVDLSKNPIQDFKLLPLGSVLVENIRKDWLQSKGKINTYVVPSNGSVQRLDEQKNAFNILKTEKFREDFLHVKNNFQKELPLAIKEEISFEGIENTQSESNSFAKLPNGRMLCSSYFVNESLAQEYFFKIQRERKIWWMRFSRHPGRYFLTDLKSEVVKNQKTQSVKIASKFNFGDLELEKIHLVPLKSVDLEHPLQFGLKDTRIDRRVVPAVIWSEFCIETAALGLLFDSIENNKDRKIGLHRKIAPYQCGLLCFSKDEKCLLELADLATHLATVMRKLGVSVLNVQKCYTSDDKVLQKEVSEMDKIGVPYSITLEESSLKEGLMKLRNRDTTLSEIIHLTDVPDYFVNIVNS